MSCSAPVAIRFLDDDVSLSSSVSTCGCRRSGYSRRARERGVLEAQSGHDAGGGARLGVIPRRAGFRRMKFRLLERRDGRMAQRRETPFAAVSPSTGSVAVTSASGRRPKPRCVPGHAPRCQRSRPQRREVGRDVALTVHGGDLADDGLDTAGLACTGQEAFRPLTRGYFFRVDRVVLAS